MRNYAKVSPKFWIGETGKSFRKLGCEAQVLAMYLLTSPHSNMLGLFYLPMAYISADTGLKINKIEKLLEQLEETGFCTYDHESEMVWVYEMALYQVEPQLAKNDKRCAGIQNTYNRLPDNPHLALFFDKYEKRFHMTQKRSLFEKTSPSQAPSKALLSQEQEQRTRTENREQEREQEQREDKKDTSLGAMPTPSVSNRNENYKKEKATHLPVDWSLPQEWEEWACTEQPHWTVEQTRQVAAQFKDYWIAKAGSEAKKLDWFATWRNWVRREKLQAWTPYNKSTKLSAQAALEARNAATMQEWLRLSKLEDLKKTCE